MADINDRLERLNRREQLAQRANQPAVSAPADGLSEDFLEVLEAVARVVVRHPGLSVMVAPADGHRRTVVRVTEREGTVETALVVPPVTSEHSASPRAVSAAGAATSPVDRTAQAAYAGLRSAEDRAAAARHSGVRPGLAAAIGSGGPRAADERAAPVGYSGFRAPDERIARSDYGGLRAAADRAAAARHSGTRAGDDAGYRAADDWAGAVGYPRLRAADESTAPEYGGSRATESGRHAEGGARVSAFPGADWSDQARGPYHRPFSDREPYSRRGARPLRAVTAPPEEEPEPSRLAPDEEDERQPATAANGLITLAPDTSQVVARLAQLLREDPSLAAGWARDRDT